jgi:spoIIIJ-associated protein
MSDTQGFSDEGWDNADPNAPGSETDHDTPSASDSEGSDNPASAEGSEPNGNEGAGRRRRSRGRSRGREQDDYEFDERARKAQAFVDEVVRKMGMDCRVRLRRPREGDSTDEINLEILGKDAGRIIGKKGQVLQALQFLVHRVVNRPGLERRHILVDAEGYRSRRDLSLANMARRLGEQAVDQGKIITFEPMNPRDRRVVHLALAKFEGVITKSDGEGDQRRVQIIPVRRPTASEPS